jgi:hypothetical protein
MIRITFVFAILIAWVYQFVGHLIWRYLPVVSQDQLGLPLTAAILVCMALPLLLVKRTTHAANEFCFDRRIDTRLLLLLGVITALNWLIFASHWSALPLHTYGDEFFHNARTLIEYNYWRDVLHSFGTPQGAHFPSDFPSAHFIIYPSVAYFTTTILSLLQGDPGSIVYQRHALLIWLLPIPIAAYILGRALEITRQSSFLFALALAVSPLLASYTLSYYIEIPYISIELAALVWLVLGEKNHDAYALCLAVGLASVATLVRESTLPFAFFIVTASIYCNSKLPISRIRKLTLSFWFVFAGLIPCLLYSYAKSAYSGQHTARLAIVNFWRQDWTSLLTYGLVHLNIIMLLLALTSWLFIARRQTRTVIIAMTATLCGTLMMYGLFETGWMPWSRNYALLFAPLNALALLGLYWVSTKFNVKVVRSVLIIAVFGNIAIAAMYFSDDRLFHENEAIFDLGPALANLGHLQGDVKVYEHRPEFMRNQFVMPANVTVVNVAPEVNAFIPLKDIETFLPSDAHWILYYYYRNVAAPQNLHSAPQAPRNEIENGRYIVHSLSNDPFADGRTGVALLEKRNQK